jgi:tetratricopeptide (TPR) repeat protein
VADGAGFRFAHALVRETVAAEVGAVRRRALHRRIALALEAERERGIELPLAEILHHWCLGAGPGDALRLADHGRRAATQALERFAWEEAAATCRRALESLDALQAQVSEARCDLLALLVQAEFSLGNGPAWHEALGQAVAFARRLGQPERLARVAIYVGDMVTGMVDRSAVALYEESLASLPPANTALRAELLSGLACALYWSPGDGPRVRALADEALALARRADDPEVLAVVLNNRHLALWGPDSLDERIATSNELVAVAARSGSRRWLHDGRHRHLLDALERGDAAGARHDVAEITRLSAELRYPGWQSAPGAALLALLEGRLDDAERLAQERFERISRAGFANAAMFHATQLAAVRREQGRLDELEAGVRALVASHPNMPTWRATLAYLHCEADRVDSARRELEALLPGDVSDLPRDATWLTSVGLLAEVAARVGDAERSRRFAALLAPFAERMIVLGPALAVMSSVARPLALAAAAGGDATSAVAHFERALELESGFGARCLVARTKAQWAALLARAGGPASARRARTFASDALAEAAATGMRSVAAAARSTLEDLTGVVRLRRRG